MLCCTLLHKQHNKLRVRSKPKENIIHTHNYTLLVSQEGRPWLLSCSAGCIWLTHTYRSSRQMTTDILLFISELFTKIQLGTTSWHIQHMQHSSRVGHKDSLKTCTLYDITKIETHDVTVQTTKCSVRLYTVFYFENLNMIMKSYSVSNPISEQKHVCFVCIFSGMIGRCHYTNRSYHL